jgi:allantoin racemase
MKRFCRNVRAVEIEVLELEDPASDACRRIVKECQRALTEDGSDAIVLGCAGMVDLSHAISEEIDAPVVEGVTAAVKLVEALVALGLVTAKRGEYAFPLPKTYGGLLSGFSPV